VSSAAEAPPRPAEEFRVRRGNRTSVAAGLIFVGVVVLLALAPFWGDPSTNDRLVRFLTLLCLAQMWNPLAGYAGLVSIGQQAFIGIGAYTLIFFGNNHGVNVFVCVGIAGVVAALLALPIAGAAFRLRGGYFAIGTWVIAEVCRLIVANVDSLGGGAGTSLTAVIGIDIETRQRVTLWLALAAGAGSIVLVHRLLRARLGTALTALRDAEPAARSLGVPVTRARLIAFVVAAAGTGVAGAIIYLNLLRVQPNAAFSVNWTAYMIFIVVIGGIGTIEGPIIGAILFFFLQEQLADQGSLYLILLGLIAVGVTLKLPDGIWGWVVRRWDVHLFPVARRLER
jgi:branched-chain amino acid transport system permease protein